MSHIISNPSGDHNERIASAVNALGRSKDRKKIFLAIYTGKQQIKTVKDLMSMTRLSNVRVLQEAAKLAAHDIVAPLRVNGENAYKKDLFYALHRDEILSYYKNPKKLNRLSTKSNPIIQLKTISVPLPKKLINADLITIDDIDSFSRIKKINASNVKSRPDYESLIKHGLCRILKEKYVPKDWGGETDDLFSTHLSISGKRLSVSFALKGKATSGKLTPRKMGTNGDQILRLFRNPADVFLIQYHGPIEKSILEQMRALAICKSVTESRKIYFGIIDGTDTARLIKAYPQAFSK